MKSFERSRSVYALAAALLLSACQTTQKTPIDNPSTQEGLVRVDTKGVDAAYKKPGANLAVYSKVLLRQPVTVSFNRNWKPEQDSALYSMNQPDREKIKQELSAAFAEGFKQVLDEKGGYQMVTEPAKDVLEVQAAIVNLYINAPDVSMQTAARVRTYTADAGEMTLISELRDSVTGALLARIYDRREGMDTGTWTWTSSVTNSADAKREIRRWAELLKKALDASRTPAAPAKT